MIHCIFTLILTISPAFLWICVSICCYLLSGWIIFGISCAGVLTANSFIFYVSEDVFISFLFLINIFHRHTILDGLFCCVAFFKALWRCDFIVLAVSLFLVISEPPFCFPLLLYAVCPFFLAAFMIVFHFQQFDSDVPRYGSLYIYPAWYSHRFLHQSVDVFN